jgi:hypothetical protein
MNGTKTLGATISNLDDTCTGPGAVPVGSAHERVMKKSEKTLNLRANSCHECDRKSI